MIQTVCMMRENTQNIPRYITTDGPQQHWKGQSNGGVLTVAVCLCRERVHVVVQLIVYNPVTSYKCIYVLAYIVYGWFVFVYFECSPMHK